MVILWMRPRDPFLRWELGPTKWGTDSVGEGGAGSAGSEIALGGGSDKMGSSYRFSGRELLF